MIGKRTLSDYQAHQIQNNQAGLNGLFSRYVKPRTFLHTSPISPLSPIDFSAASTTTTSSLERYSLPILQQFRPQPISIGNRIVATNNNNNNAQALPGVPCVSTSSSHVSEQKIMNDRLQELEKQLLDDDDDDVNEEENDAVSVITNANSEWSETIQNLISPTSQKPPISLSPTSSSSSSSSSSVASPGSTCSKQCIIDAATNISEGKSQVASEILTRLARFSNPKGNSEERLMSYWVYALKSRVNSVENPPSVNELFYKEHVESTQLLYDMSPCFMLGFMAANLAILEATLDESDTKSDNNNRGNKIHVIDFDIGQGGQYVYLLHALAARQNGKSFIVKITAVADNSSQERLTKVGNALTQEAKKVGVCFAFKTVTILKLGDLTRESLGCEPDESLVVNFAFKLYRMADESVSTDNPRDELLRRVKGLGPRVVILVEQEMNTNTAPFMARVTETCSYYGALFDSFEATMKRDNSERVKIEEGLGRKLGNSVACEGRDRVERCEVFGKWRARMGMAGFELKPLSQNVSETLKAKLTAENRVNPGFTVTDQNGGVCIGWMGRTLTVASAWR
ncbi:scarecrow-like protein 8 [Quercus suber]|uniref:Scarecrow-like protein 8 n=2 Tax=Quercus suber TaxID=58331 RepID=A0AAW0LRI0_QUESU